MRYSVQPHKHSAEYPHDGGFALYDSTERRTVGWYADKSRAIARAADRNAEDGAPVTPAAPVAAQDTLF